MGARGRDRAIPLALAALAFATAILQRPGLSSSDTKIDLHVDPGGFLSDVAALWSSSGGLGGVEAAQYAGYLFPMGPFFALGNAIGLSDWLVDRLWLGLLLAVASWGIVRLIDDLHSRDRGWAHAVAGAMYIFNPYVVVLANRTSVFLLAYALLPWFVIVARRGVLPGGAGWRLPAVFALLVTASGGGINVAVTAFSLLAPLAILFYEPLTGGASWRDSWGFAWRTAVCTTLASLWWLGPAVAQVLYGVDFLRFSEPAGAIWSTTSMSESLRLMGYWISYIGVGFYGQVTPYFGDSGVLLFSAAVVSATLMVPGLSLMGFAWLRRRRYAPFFLGLVLLGSLLMAVGYPEGTPLRKGVTYAYNHFGSLRFLRTTYKAAPLVALGLACLGGPAAALLFARLRGPGRAAAVAGVAALLALSAWPLVRGRAVDDQMVWDDVPAEWTAVAADLDEAVGRDGRAIVLPGQLYAFYRWGGTVDPILPALTDAPVAVRSALPYGDPRATDLLWTTDALVQQDRVVGDELAGMVRLIGAKQVVSATDDDVFRSAASDPAEVAGALAGLGQVREYGQLRTLPPARGDVDVDAPSADLPRVRSYTVSGVRPLVRLEPRARPVVVDGSAEGLAELSAFGALPDRRAFAYAGDLSGEQIRVAGDVLVTDSNRRRITVVSRLHQNAGATLGAADPISEDAATLDLFPDLGPDSQTVATLHGARYIRGPSSPGFAQFPEHRPFAAFDGDTRTYWLADRALQPGRHWIEVGFERPRDVPNVDVLMHAEAGAVPVAVESGGRRFPVRTGWNRLALGRRGISSLRLLVRTAKGDSAAAAGIAEVRVPGLHVQSSLRPPRLAESALQGRDLAGVSLGYAFTRASGDRPRRHASSAGVRVRRLVERAADLEEIRVASPGDEEPLMDRVFSPPAARTWTADAWVSASPEARDSVLDGMAGYRGDVRADSNGRFQGRPAFRASSALDGDSSTAWVAPWGAGIRPRIQIRLPEAVELSDIRLAPSTDPRFRDLRRPARIRIRAGGSRLDAVVGPDGRVPISAFQVAARSFSLEVLKARFPAGTRGRTRRVRAMAVGELTLPGLERMDVPRTGTLRSRCGDLALETATGLLKLRTGAPVADMDAARALRAQPCGVVQLPAGEQRVRALPGALRVDRLLLRSPAPSPVASASAESGRVLDPGEPGRGERDEVKLEVAAPSWLVLGESFDSGWRAKCDGRDLGEPEPIDGYANGWRVEPGCSEASFAFAPQRPVRWLQTFSALACLALLAIAIRPRRVRPDAPGPELRERSERLGMRIAAVAGLVAGGALAFCFSLRSGLLIAPGIAFVLWHGIGARALAIAGGGLLAVVVPVLYVAFPVDDFGGFSPTYAEDHLAAHWVAVAAWVLLALAWWRSLSTARAHGGSAGPSAP